ncbi:hypothetical protein GGX14DRAFT_699580 [Mycena pura]|uniref:Uncharacterized protein n=1 Tax=Mycena pura TaxID=153505 RepID=A0AAD6Y4C4_9AGAR|nr:hypothetical protein GGX14DRAFT_699580 [Mycena pura]
MISHCLKPDLTAKWGGRNGRSTAAGWTERTGDSQEGERDVAVHARLDLHVDLEIEVKAQLERFALAAAAGLLLLAAAGEPADGAAEQVAALLQGLTRHLLARCSCVTRLLRRGGLRLRLRRARLAVHALNIGTAREHAPAGVFRVGETAPAVSFVVVVVVVAVVVPSMGSREGEFANSGTPYATPLVAGTVASIVTKHGNAGLSPARMRAKLLEYIMLGSIT